MKSTYESQAQDAHLRDEETQWVAILASGNEYAGILLVWVQKLCAEAHDVEYFIKKKCCLFGKRGCFFTKISSKSAAPH